LVEALVHLVPACRILAFLALVVRVDSTGPVMFRQITVGKDGHEFVTFEFRTMHIDCTSTPKPASPSRGTSRSRRRAVQTAQRPASGGFCASFRSTSCRSCSR
jgi:lipopolysaccharide/colanic/teichoic acid biosynthesis glycosyltransferase